ncbi:MAG: DUF285 domain-containing protein [Eubacterium sp.]|nr:DUF285 domain-containing protein [Eubacterium sp.]
MKKLVKISILTTALIMLFICMSSISFAGTAEDTVTVDYRAVGVNGFVSIADSLVVKGDLTETYFPESIPYEPEGVSCFDAVIADHIAKYGEDSITDYLSVELQDPSWGFLMIGKMYGMNYFNGFVIGKEYARNNHAVIKNGDTITALISDESYDLIFCYFNKTSYSTSLLEPVTIELQARNWDDTDCSANDIVIEIINRETGELTPIDTDIDEEGNVSVAFNEAGEYFITAKGTVPADFGWGDITLDCVGAFATVTVEPDDTIKARGEYRGVPWFLTWSGELFLGEDGKEYTFNDSAVDTIPWGDCSSDIKRFKVLGTVHASGSLKNMLNHASNMTSVDMAGLDTSKVTDMSHMFDGCISLKMLDLSGFNTSNVINMNHMFDYCINLKTLDLSEFDTSKVTDMSCMFLECSSIKQLDVSGFDTSNVTNMETMFGSCANLTQLNLSGFDTAKVTHMAGLVNGCSKLKQLDLSGFDTSNVVSMAYMFTGCSKLTQLDLSGFNTSNIIDMTETFSGCESLTQLNIIGFDTSKVEDMFATFYRCCSLTKLDLSGFNTSNVFGMEYMFSGCSKLTQLDLSGFNTSNVIDMNEMFSECSSLKVLDLTGFDMQKVQYMKDMLKGTELTEIGLSEKCNLSDIGIGGHEYIRYKTITGDQIEGPKIGNLSEYDNNYPGWYKVIHKLEEKRGGKATCTKSGIKGYWYCSLCDKLFSDKFGENEIAKPIELPALGHDYQKVAGSAIEATCEHVGKTADQKCSRCDSLIEGEIIAKLPHDLEMVEAVKATNKSTGNIAHWKCKTCSALFEDMEGAKEITLSDVTIPENDMTVKGKKLTAKSNKEKKFKRSKAFVVKNAKGKLKFKKLNGNKKIKVSAKGNITVKKGLKSGKTYTVKVRVSSSSSKLYTSMSKTIKLKVKIKGKSKA